MSVGEGKWEGVEDGIGAQWVGKKGGNQERKNAPKS